jgi:hypothetical protein
MTNQQIQNYQNLGILKPMATSGEYRFKRPLQISVPKKIIDRLKSIYIKNGERGGVMAFAPNGNNKIICVDFIEVENMAKNSFNYIPNEAFFNSAITQILNKGFLPIVVHTHPTELGFSQYDSKRVQFYLKSSKPDRIIARNGVVPFLNMPECIFVQDERFNGGFALNFFTGGIFPQSVTSLTSLQFVSLGIGIISYFMKNKIFTLASGAVFFTDFVRKPKYSLDNGGLRVTLSV